MENDDLIYHVANIMTACVLLARVWGVGVGVGGDRISTDWYY